MKKIMDSHKTILSATCLLLSTANADDIVEESEISIIKEIIVDFFNIPSDNVEKLLNEAKDTLENSVGLFEFGQQLNSAFDLNDKLDFISCIYEVAYIDKKLHYLEEHKIKKLANILNINKLTLKNIKMDNKKN